MNYDEEWPAQFFLLRREHLLPGREGLELMYRWLELDTDWRSPLLERLRTEAVARRLSSRTDDRVLALQALAYVGEEKDAPLFREASEEDDLVRETRQQALEVFSKETASLETLAAGVHDRDSFAAFLRALTTRRFRTEHLLSRGFSDDEIRPRDCKWAFDSIARFLDNAGFLDDAPATAKGPTWRELADALLRGRDWQ